MVIILRVTTPVKGTKFNRVAGETRNVKLGI